MTDQQTEVIRCAWECDAGEIRDAVTGGRFSCNLREESIAHRHSAECPADHEDWYACHRFVAPRAAAPAEVDAEARAGLVSATQKDVILAMLRGEQTCEKSHRDGERYAHVHADTVHAWAVSLMSLARAALATPPAVAPEVEPDGR